MAQKVAHLMGKPLRYRLIDFHRDNPAHDIHYGLEDNKLRPGGWRESKSTEECLKEVIEWQSAHPEWIS
jgi:dTDP-D-glucose 4,6-dehydratase